MAYITFDQFVAIYGDQGLTSSDFPMYATSASAIIDSVTRYTIPRCGGLSAFPKWVQQAVQQAAGAQVLYYTQNGLETVQTGQTGQGFTVGKVSVNGGAVNSGNSSGDTSAQSLVSPLVRALLEQTGLMGRDVACYDRSRSSFSAIW